MDTVVTSNNGKGGEKKEDKEMLIQHSNDDSTAEQRQNDDASYRNLYQNTSHAVDDLDAHIESLSTSSYCGVRHHELSRTVKPLHSTPYGIGTMILFLLSTTLLMYRYLIYQPQGLQVDICDIMCYGAILSTLQRSGHRLSVTLLGLDMPLKYDHIDVWHQFWSLPDLQQDTLVSFMESNFYHAGSDVLPWIPDDYAASPTFLQHIIDPTMREWARSIHKLWAVLGRKIDADVYAHPQRHTLLPLRHDHMVVPGGTFHEMYYWDTYFIVLGLLVSNMYGTAQHLVENLVGLVEDYGHVPNGSRRYYLNRSQPPFLTQMVQVVYSQTRNMTWLQQVLPALDKEYNYWMTLGQHAVEVVHPGDTTHTIYHEQVLQQCGIPTL